MNNIDYSKFMLIRSYLQERGINLSVEYNSDAKTYLYTFSDDSNSIIFKLVASWVLIPKQSTILISER